MATALSVRILVTMHDARLDANGAGGGVPAFHAFTYKWALTTEESR